MILEHFADIYKKGGFSFEEAHSEIYYALEIISGLKYEDFILGKTLSDWQIMKAEAVFKERVSSRKPLQQILGQAFFSGRRFFVNEYTLIPRPETEMLVKAVLNCCLPARNSEILDIGTGSGCIGISLMLENSGIKADMSDIQKEVLTTAEKNAFFHNVRSTSGFILSDLFENIDKKYDVIVSNPPYIPLKERETLEIEVRKYEPSAALFALDDEGLEYYEKIIKDAHKYLKAGGMLAFEAGKNQAQKIKQLLENAGYTDIVITKDFNNIERVITAEINE